MPQSSPVLWFRRDLRLHDNPALVEAARTAAAGAGSVVALFVLDDRLWEPAGLVRRAWLIRSLRALDESLGGSLVVRHGDPQKVVAEVAAAAGATQVHIAQDFGPYGRTRDAHLDEVLGPDVLVRTGSPYAVAPGRITKGDSTPYRVYTPFYRAWMAHGWRSPADDPTVWPTWRSDEDGPLACDGIPAEPDLGDLELPAAGEQAALARWAAFAPEALEDYDENRNRADLAGTSAMGAHLRWGEIHPRTLLAELGDSPGHTTYRKELAWREFYADVLATHPGTARDYLDTRFAAMTYDTGPTADDRFTAWTQGCTGYPFVDAGMRQLLAEGWMHNRVRMVVASFLVKDLHLPWQMGARWFMRWLRDGDLASNQHGWQWVAGSGTDASPYFRVFNPVLQGKKFDPLGDYVRRYVPELSHIPGASVHEPWNVGGGLDRGYPHQIVDHGTERNESLARYSQISGKIT